MLNYEKSVKKSRFRLVLTRVGLVMQKSYQWGQQAYLIQNMCRYENHRVESADIVLEKKDETSLASKYFCNL